MRGAGRCSSLRPQGDSGLRGLREMTPAVRGTIPAGRGISLVPKSPGSVPESLLSPSASVLPRTSEAAPVFQTRGLTKIYKMGQIEVQALRGIDLELYSGELVVLLGASLSSGG